jgi:dynactin complex subunit
VKTNGEKPLTSNKIEKNIKALKGKLKNNTSQLYQHLFSAVNKVSVSKLTWKDPLANQVISDDSVLVRKMSPRLIDFFMVKFFFSHAVALFLDLDIILIYATIRNQWKIWSLHHFHKLYGKNVKNS